MTIHLFASCPMGKVVDPFGNLLDVDGLTVSDASIFCGAPGVNPQGTVMALAKRNVKAYLSKS